MASTDGPKYPGIKEGLVYAFDPKNQKCWKGGTTSISDLVSETTGTPTAFDSDEFDGALTTEGYLTYDGTDDYIITTMDGTSSSRFGSGDNKELTISFWVNLDDTSAQKGMFQWANVTKSPSPMVLIISVTNLIKFYVNNGYRNLSGGISAGTWYNFTLTHAASDNTWRSYLNGVANTSYVGGVHSTHEAIADDIYFMNGYNAMGDGKMGPFLLYDRALSAGEVLTNYNRLKGRFGL